MRIVLCDDEVAVTNQINQIINEYIFEHNMTCSVQTYQSGKELLKDSQKYDVAFLDIDMGDISGIETAKKLRETDKHIKIIYVTNYTNYHSEAFNVHAFSYLVKPVHKEQIYKTLTEVISYLNPSPKLPMIEVNTTKGLKNISIKDIFYFEYNERQVKMVSKQETYFIKQSISQVESMMSPFCFAMPHKSFVVNLLYVKGIRGYDIYIMDGSILPLSQKKSVFFRKQLNCFIEKQTMK